VAVAASSAPTVAAPPAAKPLSRVGLTLSILVLVMLIGLSLFVTLTDQRTPPPLLSSPTIAVTATVMNTATPLPTNTP
ncbi:MAG: serine/threonine-protein phosphatase, partial [Chloroflexus sp.]